MLTIEKIKLVDIPKNISRANNLRLSPVSVYNDSVNLYQAITTVLTEEVDVNTDLGVNQFANIITLTSSTGADVTILPATTGIAGVMSAADKIELNDLRSDLSDLEDTVAGLSSLTIEEIRDDIGGILTDTSTIDFVYNSGVPSITAAVKSNSISNTHLTSATGGIYKSSGTIASGVEAKLTSTSTFRIAYSDDTASIHVDDLDSSLSLYSKNGTNFIYINNNNIELASSGGLVLPNLTTTERDAIGVVAEGATIYNTTTNKLNFYNGSTWEQVTSA